MPDREDKPVDLSDQPTVTTPGGASAKSAHDSRTESAGPPAGRVDETSIPSVVGNVEIQDEIGRGGMGIVYRGWDGVLRRPVAVKFLLNAVADEDDRHFQQFLAGARAEAAIRHPNVVAVQTGGVLGGIPYIVMDYIEGPTLRELSKECGPLPLPVALAVMSDVTSAVAALHERDLIHRDLKPSNVLFDQDAHLFVTDFGLASLRRRSGTTGTPVGTPTYMAPEMFQGIASRQSDVYALGIMLFELLNGRAPFDGDLPAVRDQHCQTPLPVEVLSQSIPPALVEVIERATHKKEMLRYKTAAHFLRALQESGATEEVLREGSARLKKLILKLQAGDATGPETQERDEPSTTTYFDRLTEIADEKRRTREPTCEAGASTAGREIGATTPTVQPVEQSQERASPISGSSDGGSANAGKTPDGEPAGHDEDNVSVADESRCIHCGYNLHGLSPGGRCPECGTGIARSIKGDLLAWADPEWLRVVYRGQVYIAVGCVLFLLTIPIGWLLESLKSALGAPAYVWEAADTGLSILPMLFVLIGVVGITSLDPRVSLTEQPLALRRVVRAAAIVALILAPLAQYLVVLANANVSVDPILDTAIGGAGFVALFFTIVAATYYLACLAKRIPDEDLAQRSRVTARRFAIWMIVAYVGANLNNVVRTASGSSWVVKVPSGISIVVAFVASLVFLIAGLSLIGIWWTYRKVLKRCLIEARRNESEYPIGPPAHSTRTGNAVMAPLGDAKSATGDKNLGS